MSVELGSATAVKPDRDTAVAWLDQGRSVPLYREILADLETPVSAYLKIAGGGRSFLLESVESSDRLGRYSFIGSEPYSVVRMRDGVQRICPDSDGEYSTFDDPLKVIEAELARRNAVSIPELPRFQGGAVGFLGYEVVRHFEELPPPGRDDLGLPDALLMFVDTFIVFDHLHRTIKLVSQAVSTGDPAGDYDRAVERIDRLHDALSAPNDARSLLPFAPSRSTTLDQGPANMTRREYEDAVVRTKEYIAAGDIIQAVISLRLVRELDVSAFSVYRHLRRVNPSPYMYFLDMGGFQVVGASPEMLVQAEGRRVKTRPLAGTRPRGANPEEDSALADELMASDKERAEHVMLVDLGRNDVGRVAEGGTVHVSTLMAVERYSHVMHIVSEVEGDLESGKTGLDALRACFPAGTLSGAPKIRAMEIMAEMEPTRRGLYGGAVGYFSFSGDVDTAITIRTMVAKDGLGYVQAGAGIVADSDPEMEYEECMSKARAVMRAINLAQEAENASRNR